MTEHNTWAIVCFPLVQFCEHLRWRARNAVGRKADGGGVRGVGTLGIFATKVLFAYVRCPWPEVDHVIRAKVCGARVCLGVSRFVVLSPLRT